MLSGQYTFELEVIIEIELDFEREVASGGMTILPVTLTVSAPTFSIEQGRSLESTVDLAWIGLNQITVSNMKFSGSEAGWVSLVERLPKALTKEVGLREGYGEVVIRVTVPMDAETGEYTVPVTVEVEAVWTKVTANGYLTFAVIRPAPGAVPDYMTILLAALLLALVAAAYLRR